MRKALVLVAAFGALALLLAVAGALLPVAHTAQVRLELGQAPELVYEAVADVSRYSEWRSGLDSLRIVSTKPRLRWRESTAAGTVEFEQVAAIPPRSVRAEIQGAKEQGFGGSWTWEIAPGVLGGTLLTITERGEVYNPLFRLLSRTFFSPYGTLERFARDLAARFGENAVPERVLP